MWLENLLKAEKLRQKKLLIKWKVAKCASWHTLFVTKNVSVTFFGKVILVVFQPLERITNRVLVELQAELDERSLSGVVSLGKVFILETVEIVTDTGPEVFER